MLIQIFYSMIIQIFFAWINKKNKYIYKSNFFSFIISLSLVILTYFNYGLNFQSFIIITLIQILINVSIIDYIYLEIPIYYVYLILFIGLINFIHIKDFSVFLTIILNFVSFLILSFISELGGGDIKLVSSLGFFIPLYSLEYFLFFTFVIGLIISFILMILKKKGFRDSIPFGPFFSIGAVLNLFIVLL